MKQLNELPQWKGYSMEELNIRRAEILARKEIEKYRLSASLDGLRKSSPLLGGAPGFMGKASGWFSYIEYGLIAYRVARRFLPFLRRRK